MEKCCNFYKILLGWALTVLKCLQRIFPHEKVDVIDSFILSQRVVDFEAPLEKVFKRLKHLRVPAKRGYPSVKRSWHWGKPVEFGVKDCRVADNCQLLKNNNI